jgi:hypothetical protein
MLQLAAIVLTLKRSFYPEGRSSVKYLLQLLRGRAMVPRFPAGKLGCATVRSERPDDVMLVRLLFFFFYLQGFR